MTFDTRQLPPQKVLKLKLISLSENVFLVSKDLVFFYWILVSFKNPIDKVNMLLYDCRYILTPP